MEDKGYQSQMDLLRSLRESRLQNRPTQERQREVDLQKSMKFDRIKANALAEFRVASDSIAAIIREERRLCFTDEMKMIEKKLKSTIWNLTHKLSIQQVLDDMGNISAQIDKIKRLFDTCSDELRRGNNII